jgi:2-polyprenyl-6-methoxyphenol hydroxylase-like FAD-dependent oxidoreductase
MSVEHAAIIGAGVAGLTAALALAKHGISSEIFEQAPALTKWAPACRFRRTRRVSSASSAFSIG